MLGTADWTGSVFSRIKSAVLRYGTDLFMAREQESMKIRFRGMVGFTL